MEEIKTMFEFSMYLAGTLFFLLFAFNIFRGFFK